MREVAERARPDVALANHLVMGPAILARALGAPASRTRSRSTAARWSTRSSRTRASCPYAREGLAGARGVLVGSRHTAESLWAAMDDPELPARTRLGPPGVDVERFAPARAGRGPRRAWSALRERLATAEDAAGGDDSSFARDPGEAAAALATIGAGRPPRRLRGQADRLQGRRAAARRLAARAAPACRRARLVIVGFGAFRRGARGAGGALARGDLEAARATRGENGAELP